MARVAEMMIGHVSVRVVLQRLTGGGQGVEAVFWMGGGVAMAKMSLLPGRQVRFDGGTGNMATGGKEIGDIHISFYIKQLTNVTFI